MARVVTVAYPGPVRRSELGAPVECELYGLVRLGELEVAVDRHAVHPCAVERGSGGTTSPVPRRDDAGGLRPDR